MPEEPNDLYAQAGVDIRKEELALQGLRRWVEATFALRKGLGAPRLGLGPYANVIDIGQGRGLALAADGVGSKVLVAQMMDRYDTVGIDCVAMNVNDLICVGAEPLALVDYIALQEPEATFLEDIGKGLYEGARRAGVVIAGGEIAQLPEILRGEREGRAFDLAAAGVGIVALGRIVQGEDLSGGDTLIGLASSGVHSNGLTLARRVFFRDRSLDPFQHFEELGRSLGEELLEPTRIYVPLVMELLRSGLHLKALYHITGDGFLNLTRHQAAADWVIEHLPEAPPIFGLIQRYGQVSDREMFTVFNMGVGFCVAVPEEEGQQVLEVAARHQVPAWQIGRATAQKGPRKRVVIEPKGLELST
jgi:phosphoribosylformylglycinamidine cyclo-ligase